MDDEMIERCVKAVAQCYEQNGGLPYEALGKHAKVWIKDEALSVIKAMREPTTRMEMDVSNWQGPQMTYSDVWRAMIDSILND